MSQVSLTLSSSALLILRHLGQLLSLQPNPCGFSRHHQFLRWLLPALIKQCQLSSFHCDLIHPHLSTTFTYYLTSPPKSAAKSGPSPSPLPNRSQIWQRSRTKIAQLPQYHALAITHLCRIPVRNSSSL